MSVVTAPVSARITYNEATLEMSKPQEGGGGRWGGGGGEGGGEREEEDARAAFSAGGRYACNFNWLKNCMHVLFV